MILGLPADLSRDGLLAALDAAGEASGAPLLIFVDALNERDPRDAWKNDLASFVAQVRRFPNLRLCLSCPTTYLDAVMPDDLVLPQVEHRGFAGVEHDAIFRFFAHWHLQPPSVPLLEPEYRNPLFLRMLCVGLARSDRPALAERPPTLAEVVNLLLESSERAAEERLDVDRRSRLVHRAVDAVVAEMRRAGTLHVGWERASELVNALLPDRPRSRSLLDFLLREGILREVQTGPRRGDADQVRFGFDRLGEFLVARRLVEEAQSPDDVSHLVSESGLFALADPASGFGNAAGLFEALAVLLPERFGLELVAFDVQASDELLLLAAVRSLPWRAPDSLTPATMHMLRRALATTATFELALEEALALAARGQHPLGSFIDRLLRPKGQAERDAMLCPFLHMSCQGGGVARRLSDWALQPELGRLSAESALDWATTLSWFCSSADRRVRDHATMAFRPGATREPAR